jgi:nucleotide-binding universal stress UspA family protein
MASPQNVDATPSNNDTLWIVAHDFSTCADAAAQLALADLRATRGGGRLLLVHVFSVMLPPTSIEGAALANSFLLMEQSAVLESTRALERVAERLRSTHGAGERSVVEVEVYARSGTPAEAIVEEADKRNASRIYVGTHGRTGVTHLLLGSVAERIVRRAHVPVIVAHARTDVVSAPRAESAAQGNAARENA